MSTLRFHISARLAATAAGHPMAVIDHVVNDGGTWVRYRDHVAEVERLTGIIHASYEYLPTTPNALAFADCDLTPHVVAVADEFAVQRAQLDAERRANERLTADLAAARAERDQLAGLVDDLTLQSTYGIQDEENGDGVETFDSGAISAFADGLRDMARRGKVRITHDVGRRVIAVFTDEELARQEREVEEHRERFRAALATLPTKEDDDAQP